VAFPEFDSAKQTILFFSRGRGRGHAIPDSEIVKELQQLRDDVDVRFVSYGTGARTIRELRYPLIDLGLPDDNPLFDTVILAGKMIGWLQPQLVVAHEEFAVLPAAKIFDRKVLFLTDWFVEETDLRMGMLRFADQILFLDHKEIYEEPSCVQGRIHYLDPIVRDLRYSRKDKERARAELNALIASNPDPDPASIAPLCHDHTQTRFIDIPQFGTVFRLHNRPGWNFQHQIRAVSAVHLAAGATPAVFCPIYPGVPEVSQRGQAVISLEDYVATATAIAPIGTAARDELFSPKARRAVTTGARDDADFYEIDHSQLSIRSTRLSLLVSSR